MIGDALPEGRLTFRFPIVGSGNCPIYASGGQPEALLATDRGKSATFSLLPPHNCTTEKPVQFPLGSVQAPFYLAIVFSAKDITLLNRG